METRRSGKLPIRTAEEDLYARWGSSPQKLQLFREHFLLSHFGTEKRSENGRLLEGRLKAGGRRFLRWERTTCSTTHWGGFVGGHYPRGVPEVFSVNRENNGVVVVPVGEGGYTWGRGVSGLSVTKGALHRALKPTRQWGAQGWVPSSGVRLTEQGVVTCSLKNDARQGGTDKEIKQTCIYGGPDCAAIFCQGRGTERVCRDGF